jgi:hypothetical protein
MPTVAQSEGHLSEDSFEFSVEVSMLEIYNEMVQYSPSIFKFLLHLRFR